MNMVVYLRESSSLMNIFALLYCAGMLSANCQTEPEVEHGSR